MPRYIDADAFLLAEIERCGSQPVIGTCTMDNEYLSIRIAAAPTISPDEVRDVGKWEQKEIFGVKETTIEQMQSACCSVCGKYHTTPYSYYFSKYNYCPNCGAKMSNDPT